MSLEACPHCHEQVHKTEDGCGTERCVARRAFIRGQVGVFVASALNRGTVFPPEGKTAVALAETAWSFAALVWSVKPEGC